MPSNEKCNYGAQNFLLNIKQSKGSTDPFRIRPFRVGFFSAAPKRTKITCPALQSRKRTIITATKESPVLLCPREANMKPPNACTHTSAANSFSFHSYGSDLTAQMNLKQQFHLWPVPFSL